MKFKVTLEHREVEGRFTFAEVDDCFDEEELFNHCRQEFPEFDIIYFGELK